MKSEAMVQQDPDGPDTPLGVYYADLKTDGFVSDPAQLGIVRELQRLYDALEQSPERSFLERLTGRGRREAPAGIYILGGVGRGKTYLTDMFFNCLRIPDKLRLHYHRFMKRIHDDLREFKGKKDPLAFVAGKLAREARLLVLDEFFVSDIADAMILGRLLGFLFKNGVTLVTTSNTAPDDLYRDGLQRDRFLPAIDLIKAHTVVLSVEGDTDYRLRSLQQASVYYSPLSAQSATRMERSFSVLARNLSVQEAPSLHIEGRQIPAVRQAPGMVWFTFDVLCNGPRSQNDYIAISREFHTVFVSDACVMDSDHEDIMRRFINLVDEFYDRNVNLILSAQVLPDKIYTGTRLVFEYRRTLSRLQEMQSTEYLSKPHTP